MWNVLSSLSRSSINFCERFQMLTNRTEWKLFYQKFWIKILKKNCCAYCELHRCFVCQFVNHSFRSILSARVVELIIWLRSQNRTLNNREIGFAHFFFRWKMYYNPSCNIMRLVVVVVGNSNSEWKTRRLTRDSLEFWFKLQANCDLNGTNKNKTVQYVCTTIEIEKKVIFDYS